MKKKIIYKHIIFLIIMALILSVLYKNYAAKTKYLNIAFEGIKSRAFVEIGAIKLMTERIVSNFDKDGFSMENILYLKSKVKSVSYIINAINYMEVNASSKTHDYLRSMYDTFSSLDGFLSKVSAYIKNGNKPFNLLDDNDNKFLIKTKKDIYNELLLYYDLFSKLDVELIRTSTYTELFNNKIIKNWDIEKANKIVYLTGRTKK